MIKGQRHAPCYLKKAKSYEVINSIKKIVQISKSYMQLTSDEVSDEYFYAKSVSIFSDKYGLHHTGTL